MSEAIILLKYLEKIVDIKPNITENEKNTINVISKKKLKSLSDLKLK